VGPRLARMAGAGTDTLAWPGHAKVKALPELLVVTTPKHPNQPSQSIRLKMRLVLRSSSIK